MAHENLLNVPETLLPEDGPDAEVARGLGDGAAADSLAARFPDSMLAWATLAEDALDDDRDVDAYAYARTGYHRGLDALRRNGWKGTGPVPLAHAPNQGFLRALAALGEAAARIGESDEEKRVSEFLTTCDPKAAEGIAAVRG